ncbi:MAG: FecR domain-containing protein [Bacteroidia bacterium]|nr:FecR domain-containing protein [Bacteroidia bacterium]
MADHNTNNQHFAHHLDHQHHNQSAPDIHNPEIEYLDRLMAGWTVPATRTREEAWDQFRASIAARPAQEARVIAFSPRRIWGAAAAAAAVLLICISGGVFFTRTSEIIAQAGETEMVNLPDESVATLNAGSVLRYSSASWMLERQVSLEGEAFFQVQRGSQFTVKTSAGAVAVLGTSFNVKHRGDILEVVCHTGKVSVTSANSQVVTLMPGQKAIASADGALTVSQVITGDQPGWMKGMFEYEDVAVQDVLAEIARQFEVTVTYTGPASKRFTGVFYDHDLREALISICDPMELSFIFDHERGITVSAR